MTPLPGATVEQQIQHIALNALDQDALSQAMQKAVAEGIRAAVSDPNMWSAAGAAMQQQAKSTAGNWLFGGIRAALSKFGWALLFLLAIYMVGGLSAVVAGFKALAGGHTP